jgi:hypothetical protein
VLSCCAKSSPPLFGRAMVALEEALVQREKLGLGGRGEGSAGRARACGLATARPVVRFRRAEGPSRKPRRQPDLRAEGPSLTSREMTVRKIERPSRGEERGIVDGAGPRRSTQQRSPEGASAQRGSDEAESHVSGGKEARAATAARNGSPRGPGVPAGRDAFRLGALLTGRRPVSKAATAARPTGRRPVFDVSRDSVSAARRAISKRRVVKYRRGCLRRGGVSTICGARVCAARARRPRATFLGAKRPARRVQLGTVRRAGRAC